MTLNNVTIHEARRTAELLRDYTEPAVNNGLAEVIMIGTAIVAVVFLGFVAFNLAYEAITGYHLDGVKVGERVRKDTYRKV